MQILRLKQVNYLNLKRAILLISTVATATSSSADPVDDILDICTRVADDPLERVEQFLERGWSLTDDMDSAALAYADSSSILTPPTLNSPESWGNHLSDQRNLMGHQRWSYILQSDENFLFLRGLNTDNSDNTSTCALATQGSPRSTDLFSESEALGTLDHDQGVYRGRISRTRREHDDKGWISVIFLASLAFDAKVSQKLQSSQRITVVNGRL